MKKNGFSLRAVLFGPMLFSLLLIGAIIYSYVKFVDSLIDDEYKRIESTLIRTTKVIRALEYSFTHYVNSDTLLPVEHNSRIEDNLCKVWPSDSTSILKEEESRSVGLFNISYMMVGETSLCDENSLSSRQVMKSVSLAPLISVLHDLDDYIMGVHYIGVSDYVVSSPEQLANSLNVDILKTLRSRPFWRTTIDNENTITASGPNSLDGLFFGREIIGLSVPVIYQDELRGVALVQIDINQLIGKSSLVSGQIRVQNLNDGSLPQSAYRARHLLLPDINFNHALYYELNWSEEIGFFLHNQTSSLGLVLLLYLAGVVGFFYFNTRQESVYFKKLAHHDPMTGLLNRRGLDTFLTDKEHNDYYAISVLDIDNFKSINDTYGHDVGDDVICYIGRQVQKSIRNSDAVARFGGEEFVVYVTASEVKQIEQIMQRITKAIVSESTTLTPNGFTVSGGVVIVEGDKERDFDVLFKAADEKLYEAKTTGKNKLVY